MVPDYPGTDRMTLLRRIDGPEDPTVEPDPNRQQALEKLRSLGYIL
jgi:hypothetical protein